MLALAEVAVAVTQAAGLFLIAIKADEFLGHGFLWTSIGSANFKLKAVDLKRELRYHFF
jgi:hypothetical protein